LKKLYKPLKPLSLLCLDCPHFLKISRKACEGCPIALRKPVKEKKGGTK